MTNWRAISPPADDGDPDCWSTPDRARVARIIAEAQYRGLVAYINVLTAQSAFLSAIDQLAQSRQAAAQDLVVVYKAAAGGWQE
jgi:outer membrane protein TolC